MAALTKYDYSTDYAEFCISGAAELPKLPNTSRGGADELAGYDKIKAGTAYTTDGNFDVYTLDTATDEWNKIGGE